MSEHSLRSQLERVNKELWLLLSLFAIAALLNFIVMGQRMILAFYTLPTVASAYLYGRRHATLTALASVLLVVLLTRINPTLLADSSSLIPGEQWVDITVWGGTLIVTAYLMGSLYEHKDAQVKELRDTYNGILMILRHFVSKDKYTENRPYRKAMSPYEVREILTKGSGTEFDPKVVDALLSAFRRGAMEVPTLVL